MGSAKNQGEIWGARAQDWADANEPAWEPVYSALLDRLNLRTGDAFLDIGCGAGGMLLLAQRRGFAVCGIDASENLVAIARARLPGATIEVGEMEKLPFPDAAFDAAVGVNSFQFASNPIYALCEARRVCRPGGKVTMLVWGPKEHCEMLNTVLPPVFALMPPSPTPATPPLSNPGIMESLMPEARLAPGQRIEIDVPLVFPDHDTAIRAVMSAMTRPIRHAGEIAVRGTISEGLHRIASGEGAIALKSRFCILTGTRE
jgi:SAM-dependent methyltransferase